MKIHCYVRRQWRLLKITSIVIPWKVERIFLPFLILRVQILHFLRDNMFSCKHESCLKRLIWKELLILSILLRTCRSKRLALNPHLDFTDDREVHLRRKRCLTRDPREDVHCFAVQQRFILIQLITRQTKLKNISTFSFDHFPKRRSTSSIPRWRERWMRRLRNASSYRNKSVMHLTTVTFPFGGWLFAGNSVGMS